MTRPGAGNLEFVFAQHRGPQFDLGRHAGEYSRLRAVRDPNLQA